MWCVYLLACVPTITGAILWITDKKVVDARSHPILQLGYTRQPGLPATANTKLLFPFSKHNRMHRAANYAAIPGNFFASRRTSLH